MAGLYLRDMRALTNGFSPGREAAVLNRLLEISEAEAMRAVTQIIFRHNAEEAAVEIEAALAEASHHLERLAEARDRARAAARAIRADLDAAEAELAKVGPGYRERELSPEKSAVSKLTRDYRKAGEALRDAIREHGAAEKRVGGMSKVLAALRSVQRADRQVLTALAEALNDVG